MNELKMTNLSEAIQAIKSAILNSRYCAAALANRELLSLYYGIGKYISENSRNSCANGARYGKDSFGVLKHRFYTPL